VDTVTDFVSGTDKLAISQSVFGIGSDLVLDNAVVKAGPGGFDADAELVILTQNVATLNASTAAAAIGSANSAYAVGDRCCSRCTAAAPPRSTCSPRTARMRRSAPAN
jgi:hypothetical protein